MTAVAPTAARVNVVRHTESTSTPPVLRKHMGAVQIRNDLSLLERKAFSVLLVNAYDDLPNFAVLEHAIPIKTLGYWAGFKSNNIQYLKDALLSLMTTPLQWNVQSTDGKDRWAASTALASVRFDNGQCHYAFSPELRRRLHNPEVYAQLDLAVVRAFKGRFALALFENCMLFADEGTTPSFTPEALRDILGASSNADFDQFRRLMDKVIKPAVREINSQSPLELEPVVYRGAGNKVTAVRFSISVKGGAGQGEVQMLANPLIGRDLEVTRRLQDEAGLGYEQVVQLCAAHTDARLRLALDYVAGKVRAGKVQKAKFAPYFLTTVKSATDESLGATQPGLALAVPAATEVNQRVDEEAMQAKAKREASQRRMEQAAAALDALDEAERDRLVQAFMAFQADDNPVVYSTLRRRGVATGMGRLLLLQHLLDRGQLVIDEAC